MLRPWEGQAKVRQRSGGADGFRISHGTCVGGHGGGGSVTDGLFCSSLLSAKLSAKQIVQPGRSEGGDDVIASHDQRLL